MCIKYLKDKGYDAPDTYESFTNTFDLKKKGQDGVKDSTPTAKESVSEIPSTSQIANTLLPQAIQKGIEMGENMPKLPSKLPVIGDKKSFDEINQKKKDLDAQLALESKLQIEAAQSEDYAEGVAAFIEKRKPNFKGK